MQLNIIVDDQSMDLSIPSSMQREAGEFFDRMDKDMDAGWQMGRQWVEYPDANQRCQIVANKLLTALENENEKLAVMMGGYILARIANVRSVDIDTSGEMVSTSFTLEQATTLEQPPRARGAMPTNMSKLEALEQAGKDVTKVFKVGRHYRFSVYDHAGGEWQDSEVAADKQEAERLRQQAYKRRFDELTAAAGGQA